MESPGLHLKDSHKRVDEVATVGNYRMNRLRCVLRTNWCVDGSSQQGLQHAFDRFYAACDQAGTKISTVNIEVLCISRRPRPKTVYSASEWKYTAAGGDIQVP